MKIKLYLQKETIFVYGKINKRNVLLENENEFNTQALLS